jgi:glycine/D-amino acid oxidase-like deaminating enzyme
LLAPAIGKAMADLVSTGETDIDIAQFGFERFVEKTTGLTGTS